MISVILSLFNEKKIWIEQAIESILNQTYSDFEFIIVIDNPDLSNDIKEYLLTTAANDKRIKIIYNEKNIGLAKSLNKGIDISIGKYIARMDADDISLPDRLEKELLFMEKTNSDLVSAYKINIDENGNYLFKDCIMNRNINKTLKYTNIIVHPLVLVKSEVIKKMGGYRELVNSEDLDLWLRMVEQGYKISILNEYLLKYRLRSNSASIERQLEQYYISKYINKLSKERKKMNGDDSFSVKNMNIYLDHKNFSERKKKKFYLSNIEIKKSLDYFMSNKYLKFSVHIIKAFIFSPSYTIEKIFNQISNKRMGTL